MPWLAGGVLMVEASKQVYAPTQGGSGVRGSQAAEGPVLEGVRKGKAGSRRCFLRTAKGDVFARCSR